MSILVADVVRYARQHVKLAPLLGVGGTSNQPGLDFAQDVVNKIMSKPFNWKWNRGYILFFPTVENQYAYQFVTGSGDDDIAWLERAYLEVHTSATDDLPQREPLRVLQNLPVPWTQGQPQSVALEIATEADQDNNSDLAPLDRCLRLDPMPAGTIFDVYIDYQKKAPTLTYAGNFDPIPDDMGHVLRQLYLAFAYRMVDDRRGDRELSKAMMELEQFAEVSDTEDSDEGLVPMRPIQFGWG